MLRIINIGLILILSFGTAVADSFDPFPIDIIYPKPFATIGSVDSTFIFGSVSPDRVARLEINGQNISIHEEGGFIAFLPIEPGAFEFDIMAISHTSDTIFLDWPIYVPVPGKSFAYDSLFIIDKNDFYGNLSLTEGDMLTLTIQATPGCKAYFSIPGYADSVPMAEMPPRIQPYWGEAVFGTGAVPDSMKIRGFYSGFINIDYRKLTDSTRVIYNLKAPNKDEVLSRILKEPVEFIDFELLKLLNIKGQKYESLSRVYLKINSDDFPRTLRFKDSVQIVRVGPMKGYLSIFQPEGVQAVAVGREGPWIKLRLSPDQSGWVNESSIKFLDAGWPPPRSYLKVVRCKSESDRLLIEMPLSARHVYRVEEEDQRTLRLLIYGVTSDTDWIRYDFNDDNLRLAQWSQIEPEVYCLKLYFNKPIWGYDTYYVGNTLKLQINKAPQDIDKMRDKKIVIDPGHSPDPGAIGPTGLKESKANLDIALALRKELEKKGVEVIMTREDMSDLPLYDRPKIARAADADLFISIHNNALPDGVNPFENNGVSTYYYHPHSIELARSIQSELLKGTDLNDYGLYHGNLAVNRPTQYPAVLVECAFIILPEHEAMLKTEKFQKKVARSIRKGIEKFLKEYDRE